MHLGYHDLFLFMIKDKTMIIDHLSTWREIV